LHLQRSKQDRGIELSRGESKQVLSVFK